MAQSRGVGGEVAVARDEQRDGAAQQVGDVGVGDVLAARERGSQIVRLASVQSSQRDTVSATRARAQLPTGGRSPSSQRVPSRSSSAMESSLRPPT